MNNEIFRDFIYMFTPWWGKILGILFGALLAGPAGGVFGLLIGNIFDRGLFNHLYSPQWYTYRQEPPEVKNLFFSALFKVIGHIAKSDGRVSEADIETARQIMREMRLFGYKKRQAMMYYNEGKQSYFKLERTLNLINSLCRHNPGLLKLFVETIYRAAQTDGITPNKQRRINIIFSRLGFKPIYDHHRGRQYQQSNSQSSKGSRVESIDDYSLLGVSPLAKKAEVKRAYRKKISKIHPDKLIARGASKAEIQAATLQTQQLQAAYERIKNTLDGGE